MPKKRKYSPLNAVPPQFGYGYDPKRVSRRRIPPNAEIKWYDQTGGTAFVDATTVLPSRCDIASLLLFPSGDEGPTRIGNKITVTKLNLRYTVGTNITSNTDFSNVYAGDHYFRVMVFIDTQANGSTPAFTDVFEEAPHATGGDQFSIYNSLRETGRFKVLMDKITLLPAYTPAYNTATGHYHVPSRIRYEQASFKINLPVVFSDALPNNASVRNNNIFIMAFSSHSTGTNFAFSYRSRVRFTDY